MQRWIFLLRKSSGTVFSLISATVRLCGTELRKTAASNLRDRLFVEKYRVPPAFNRCMHNDVKSGQSRFISRTVSVFFEFEKVGGSRTIISHRCFVFRKKLITSLCISAYRDESVKPFSARLRRERSRYTADKSTESTHEAPTEAA